MFEEPISSILPSIWASMHSWFTPTVLFVLINVMIGTIVVISSLATTHNHNHNHHHQEQQLQHQQQLARSPSVLQRLKSINFYNYRSQQEPTNAATLKLEKFPNQYQFEQTQFFTATAAATTTTTSTQQQILEDYHQPPLSRSPSMLQRLKSINIYNYFSSSHDQDSNFTNSTHKLQDFSDTHFSQGPLLQDPRVLVEDEAFAEAEEENEGIQGQGQTLEEIYSKLKGTNVVVGRSKSDTKPASGEVPTKLPKKMKKSASTKSAFNHFGSANEEREISTGSVESRRPATVREGKAKATDSRNAGDVDAQADDFINNFKQQLKLQRIDSIIRYKEMITRGGGK